MAVDAVPAADPIGPYTVLWRLVGPEKTEPIRRAEIRSFPPRLPEQPIFYPITTEAHAVKIVRDWNVLDSGSGFIARFTLRTGFLSDYPVQMAGGREHSEYWIPAENLDALNGHMIGPVDVVHTFGR